MVFVHAFSEFSKVAIWTISVYDNDGSLSISFSGRMPFVGGDGKRVMVYPEGTTKQEREEKSVSTVPLAARFNESNGAIPQQSNDQSGEASPCPKVKPRSFGLPARKERQQLRRIHYVPGPEMRNRCRTHKILVLVLGNNQIAKGFKPRHRFT